MDVQGAEHRALLGMQKLVARSQNVILVTEFWPYGLRQSGARPEDYLNLLCAQGFELSELDEAEGVIKKVESSYLLQRYEASRSADFTNLLCRKQG